MKNRKVFQQQSDRQMQIYTIYTFKNKKEETVQGRFTHKEEKTKETPSN